MADKKMRYKAKKRYVKRSEIKNRVLELEQELEDLKERLIPSVGDDVKIIVEGTIKIVDVENNRITIEANEEDRNGVCVRSEEYDFSVNDIETVFTDTIAEEG